MNLQMARTFQAVVLLSIVMSVWGVPFLNGQDTAGDVAIGDVPGDGGTNNKELHERYAILITVVSFVAIGAYAYVSTRLKRRFGWPRVNLRGDAHRIPRVCPNCLAAADVPLRYAHRGLFLMVFGPWMGTYQTFYYCTRCSRSAKEWLRRRAVLQFFTYALTGMFTSYLLFGLTAGFIASAVGAMLSTVLPDVAAVTVAVILGILLFLMQFWLLSWVLTRCFMARTPLEPGQAVWGVAAFFTGDWDNYVAAKPEWIKEMARENYMLLSKADYARFFGEPPRC